MSAIHDAVLSNSILSAEVAETKIPGSVNTAYAFTAELRYPEYLLEEMSEPERAEYRAILPASGVLSRVEGAVIDCDEGNPFSAEFDRNNDVSFVALLLSDTDKLENVNRLMIVAKVGADPEFSGRNLGADMMERVAEALRADTIALESSPLDVDPDWGRTATDNAAQRLLAYYMRNGFKRISKFPINVLIKYLGTP
jgi:GNAT superfamily N-acetyltransferase